MVEHLNWVITLGVGIVGVAVGWGVLKTRVSRNEETLHKLRHEWREFHGGNPDREPSYIKRIECETRHAELCKKLDDHGKALKGMQNFARHLLTQQGLPLDRVNEIVNGE